MKLPERTHINFVEANNAATVVYTTKLILLFYAEKTRSIKTPK